MKGRSEITDAAAVALVQAYKRFELHLSAQSEERTQQTDGWQHLRQTWSALTEELNNQFGLAIKTEQWKKKISNIKTNVKSKRGLSQRDGKVNWSPAELEYDRLFARDGSVSTNAGSDWNDKSQSWLQNASGDACDNEQSSAMDELLEKALIVPKLETVSAFTNSTPDSTTKKPTRGMKRSIPSNNGGHAPKTPSPHHMQQTPPFSDSLLQQMLFAAAGKSQPLSSTADGFLMGGLSPYASLLNTAGFYSSPMFGVAGNALSCQNGPALQAQIEAANMQKNAAEKLNASVERFCSAMERFSSRLETLLTQAETGQDVNEKSSADKPAKVRKANCISRSAESAMTTVENFRSGATDRRKNFGASGGSRATKFGDGSRPRTPGMYRTFFNGTAKVSNAPSSNKNIALTAETTKPPSVIPTDMGQTRDANAGRADVAIQIQIARHSPTVASINCCSPPVKISEPTMVESATTPVDEKCDSLVREIPDNADFLAELQRQQEERHPNEHHRKKDSSSSRPSRTKSTSTCSEAADRKKRLTMPLIYRMYESQSEDIQGTVSGPEDDEFHPEDASKALRQALSGGIQSDDRAIINVLLAHNNFQRQKISAAYEGMYNRKLREDIEEETGGFFLDAVLALLQPAHLYSAHLLYYSISGGSYSKNIAVEIALTSTASLKVIRDSYHIEYRITLKRDLNVKVEGLFGKMLQQLLLARGRQLDVQNIDVDMEIVERDVETLISMIDNTGGIDEIGRNLEIFNQIFGAMSLNHVRSVIERFDLRSMWSSSKAATGTSGGSSSAVTTTNGSSMDGEPVASGGGDRRGRDFESLVRKSVNIHSDIRHMLLLFVRISRNMQLYFAERLHEAISGARPDHNAIIRILITRSEIDLFDICDEYKRKYGHHVVYDLQRTCSGEFLRLLCQLVNPSLSVAHYDRKNSSNGHCGIHDDVFA